MTEKFLFQNVQSYIEQFDEFQTNHPGPIPYSVQFNFLKHKRHVVFSSIIHGDEVGSLPAFIEIISKLKSGHLKFGGKVTFVLGNVPAALQNKRFIESDLNRAFNVQKKTKNRTSEQQRALSLISLLNDCDLLFDFHQTTQPTRYPFYAFGFDYKSYLWARVAGCTQMFVTRPKKQSFSATGMCIDEYVRSLGKPAVTLELSQRGFNTSATHITSLAIKRILKTADKNIFNCKLLKRQANRNKDLLFLISVQKEAFSHPQKKLTDGFTNFSFVNKNQQLGTDQNSKPILASVSGFILFPKYPLRDANGNALEGQSELFMLVKTQQNTPRFIKKNT